MKKEDLKDLIDHIAKTGLDEVEVETESIRIKVVKHAKPSFSPEDLMIRQSISAAPLSVPSANLMVESAAPEEKKHASDTVTIKSPMIGTFYTAPSPEEDPFIQVGDTVKKGDKVCVIEAMKLFNEIEAEVAGTIVEVLVEDATPVEYDQPLFLIKPA